MKSLIIALSALPLILALTSRAAAQTQLPDKLVQTAPAPPSQSPPLPVADAKKRYLATQERLQNLVKGGNLPSRLEKDEGVLAIKFYEQPRDRLRAAVAEEFDARRQLQQSELAELEGRITRIKRALSIRDAMRDAIIDQRTDELLDQLEEGGQSGQRDGSRAPGGGRPAFPRAEKGAAAPPAGSDADVTKREAQLLKLDMDEAKANLESAERAYERVQRLHASGSVSQEILDEEAYKVKRAKYQLDRAVVKMDAFLEAHRSDLPAANEPPATDGAADDQPKTQPFGQLDFKEAEVDVQEAEANLSMAKRAYDDAKKMQAKGLSEDAVEAAAIKHQRARLKLERAKAKLKALGQPPAGDERTKTTSARGPVDQNQIVWGSEDTDLLPAGEPIGSIQIGHIVEPEKSAYAPGDVLTAKLFLKYTGKQTRKLVVPLSPLLERLGIDLVLRDAAGETVNWQWGPAHKEPVRSGNVTMAFEPGAIKQFPDMKLIVGRAEMPGSTKDEAAAFAYLDAKPGQTARLRFKLTSDLLPLESEPFEFHVEEPAKKNGTSDAPVTDKH